MSEQITPLRRSWPRRILRWIMITLITIVLLLFSAAALAFIYENEIKAAIISEINKNLEAEIVIDPENIDVTIVRSFPYCSLEFSDLLMKEATKSKKRDTLVFASRLSLQFNVQDIWSGKYIMRRLSVEDALCKPVILKSGKNNYTFWKSGTTTTSDTVNFMLEDISLKNVRVRFENRQTLFSTAFTAKELSLSGAFHNADYELDSDAEILVHEIRNGKTANLRNKTLQYKIGMEVRSDLYTFRKASLKLNAMKLELTGSFRYKDSLQKMDASFSAPDLDIVSVLSLLPEKHAEKISDYKSSGTFYIDGTVAYAPAEGFRSSAAFGIRDGEIVYTPRNGKADNVNIKGSFTSGKKKATLDIADFFLTSASDTARGTLHIDDLAKPFIRARVYAQLDLNNLYNMWPMDSITSLKGSLRLDGALEASTEALKKQAFSGDVKMDADMLVTQLEVAFKDDEKKYIVEKCSLSAHNRAVEVHELMLRRGTSDIKVNGKMPGLFDYLSDPTAPLIVDGNLYSSHITLEDFMGIGTGSANASAPLIAAGVELRLNAAILDLTFGRFSATSVTGLVEVRKQRAMLSDLMLSCMDGKAELDAYADNAGGQLQVAVRSRLSGIELRSLFAQMNNFGQTTLTDKQISGRSSATIDLTGTWSNDLVCDHNSLRSTAEIIVENGRLTDFQPLQSLARFVDVKELMDIKFAKLKSNVSIASRRITIPQTTIGNSVLNIEFSGTHTFDNIVDYHFRLLIPEYLALRRKGRVEEFGPVENDPDNRRSAFIMMRGPLDDPKIEYDFKGLKEKIRDDFQREVKTFGKLIRDEFSSKKDSITRPVTHPKFELEKPASSKPREKEKEEEEDEDF